MEKQNVSRKRSPTCTKLSLVPEARKPEVRERLFSFLEEEDFGVSFD